jgi:hypothetical protein
LEIDGQHFHRINSQDLPPAWISVPLAIFDHGVEFKARMLAGCVGYSVHEDGGELEEGGKGMDTLIPEVGWWMYEVKDVETK